MNPNAAYVITNEDKTQSWSSFEEYQLLISMLYLAAKDDVTPATEGYTVETRLSHFIQELALIGRAHNWNDTRKRCGKEEEYDNLEADRLSCTSGVKRRPLPQRPSNSGLFSNSMQSDAFKQEKLEHKEEHHMG